MGMFVDDLVDADLRDVDSRERWADIEEHYVECSLRGEPAVFPHSWGPGATVADAITEQATLTRKAWSAEVYRDPGLVALVLPFMATLERLEYDMRAEAAHKPHPLIVSTAANVEGIVHPSCEGCGQLLEPTDLTLSVGYFEGWSDAPEAGPWCFSCVTQAYEAMKAAHG